MPVRAVIDTNVFVGACLGQGAAWQVVRACIEGRVRPLLGAALLAEYEDVLGRDALFQRSGLNAEERQELLDIFVAQGEWVRVYFAWRPNLPDEGDNHLVELAVAAGARFVVSRNLRDLEHAQLKFPSLSCVAPQAFLKEIEP